MSRFFATGSESDSDFSSEEDNIVKDERKKPISVEADEEETKRIVKTVADKQKAELLSVIHQIKNFKKIRDCSSIYHAFNEMIKVFEKYGEPQDAHYFFRCLKEVDEFVTEIWGDKVFRQNMTKIASKSLVALRQKSKKCLKMYNDQVEAVFMEGGGDIEGSAITDSDVASDGEEQSGSDDSSTWEESESSELSEKGPRNYFLKKATTEIKKKNEKQVRVKSKKEEKTKDQEGWQTMKSFGISAECATFLKENICVAAVNKALTVLISSKQKRRSNNIQKVHLMYELLNIAENNNLGLPLIVKVRLSIASAILSYNVNYLNAMKTDVWVEALKSMSDLSKLLQDVDFDMDANVEEEELENPPFLVRGCVVTLVQRLDEEFVKVLKECDPYGDDYIQRLKDELTMTVVIDDVLKYVERRGTDSSICQIYLSKISHMYYKLDKSVYNDVTVKDTSLLVMDTLCKFVYCKDTTDVIRTRAILFQIYYYALHDKWVEARDLMLMSHLQESIHHSDPGTQILFNRAMAQLGLCAFRIGRINDAHSCLADLMSSGKVKELLGQGFSPFRISERTREQEMRERQFQLPFHLHIPLDLVECVYLVCAMVIDIPYLAAHSMDPRHRAISKPLYLILRSIEKQCVVGPPESMKEHILAACKALRAGDWQACYKYIVNQKMIVKVWSKIQQPSQVLNMLEDTIKHAALLTFVLSFSSTYSSLKITRLAEFFDMDPKTVRQKLISIISAEEIAASLDEPSDTLVPQYCRRAYFHFYAAHLVEKLSLLIDANERACRFGQKNVGNLEYRP